MESKSNGRIVVRDDGGVCKFGVSPIDGGCGIIAYEFDGEFVDRPLGCGESVPVCDVWASCPCPWDARFAVFEVPRPSQSPLLPVAGLALVVLLFLLRRLRRGRKRKLALITSARLPPSQVPHSQIDSFLGLLDASFSDAQLAQLTVLDFRRNDLLLPAGVFLERLSVLAAGVHSEELLAALSFVQSRAGFAREGGVRLALSRTDVWTGVLETNFSVFLDS